MSAISIKNIDVIFGSQTSRSLQLLDEGKSRQDIIDLTGDVVGVHDVSLEIEEGEICVLMGLSGSGKSSLLRVLNGLNPISRGELTIRNGDNPIDLTNCDAQTLRYLRTHRTSMVFQQAALMPWLSVLDNAAFGLEMQGIAKAERYRRAQEKLEIVGLGDWKDNYPDELSGGMQQRVGLARAFSMDSDILLMDEPFSALDPLIRNQLQDELLDIQRQLNKTIVFVSHDLDEALKLGNKIAIMESGRLVQHGKPEDIVLHPNSAYVEEFVSHTNPINVLRGHALMTPIDQFNRQNNQFTINLDEQICVDVDSSQQIKSISRRGKPLSLVPWQKSDGFDEIDQSQVIVTDPDVSMRDGLEIRYRTGQPILLVEKKQLVGVLSDDNFYHALLGKHFSVQSKA